VSTVGKVPVLGVAAKAAVGSLPIVGQVVTAVGVVKRATALAAVSPQANTVLGIGPNYGGTKEGISQGYIKPKRKRKAKRKAKRRATRRSSSSKRGTAKQRAARARFARASKKGRIRKGQKL
jgi:hypothetical protein